MTLSKSNTRKIMHSALAEARSAATHAGNSFPELKKVLQNIAQSKNKAVARFLISVLVAKSADPTVDIRKPFVDRSDPTSFSGRTVDENYLQSIILQQNLPLNRTTAYLTPAFRTPTTTFLNKDAVLKGKPQYLYTDLIGLLNQIVDTNIKANKVLVEFLKILLQKQAADDQRLQTLIEQSHVYEDLIPLSTEDIVAIIRQQLDLDNSSRLPVLIIASIYDTLAPFTTEKVLKLFAHNAADSQTGSIGDLQIALDDEIVTVYEMKDRLVTIEHLEEVVSKVVSAKVTVHNYLLITTKSIDPDIQYEARNWYGRLSGTEITVLDCLDFTRYFLHLFHRSRKEFLDNYLQRVLAEPASSVSVSLKQNLLSAIQVKLENLNS